MAKSQADMVLGWLRERGQRGIHTFELRELYIGNPSERVRELKARGCVIEAQREKLNGDAVGCRYTLIEEPGVGPVAPSRMDVAAGDEDGVLFGGFGRRPSGAYEERDAA